MPSRIKKSTLLWRARRAWTRTPKRRVKRANLSNNPIVKPGRFTVRAPCGAVRQYTAIDEDGAKKQMIRYLRGKVVGPCHPHVLKVTVVEPTLRHFDTPRGVSNYDYQ